MRRFSLLLIFITLLYSCSNSNDDMNVIPTEPDEELEEETDEDILSDTELLDLTQKETFTYFWEFAHPNAGAARERYIPENPSQDENVITTGGSGFGLMNIIVGIERQFISRAEGIERLSKVVTFFESAERYHGAWSHWIDGNSGATIPFSELDDGGDLVETAFLVQGLITLEEYLKNGSTEEQALAARANALTAGVEWNWYTQGEDVLYWHWSPNNGFAINLQLKGYNETMITYILAAASQDYAITPEVYANGWASNGAISSSEVSYNTPLIAAHSGAQPNGGPLFFSHYSFLGLDPRNLQDNYIHYGNAAVNHSIINYSYCVENPMSYRDYGVDCWGLTASYSRNDDGSLSYSAHSPSNDLGVISPTAALSSMPYTPEESMRALRYFYENQDDLLGPAGFYDAFSPTYNFWVAEAYLAIDQGPITIMIENYRTQLLWNLFMQNDQVRSGLDNLGFTY